MYTVATLPTVFYVCETWFVILREEHPLGKGEFKKGVLRGICGTEWVEVRGGFRKLQNESCSTFYSPTGFLKAIKLRWARLTA